MEPESTTQGEHFEGATTPGEGMREGTQGDVLAIVVAGFDHVLGPTNEFIHPAHFAHDADLLNSNLPFLALPDGAHTKEEDYTYFHLLLPNLSPETIYGISCNRQISSDSLLTKGKEVTRSTVQKAIVVLAKKPIFGPLRDKLGLITRAYFAQKDFSDRSLLVDLYDSLRQNVDTALVEGSVDSDGEPTIKERGEEGEEGIYMGTSLRELVYKFRGKTLMLLKLLLLQRKVMFYASPSISVESLCTYQYSLVSLIPSLLLHLHDSASPSLSAHSTSIPAPTTLRTSDRTSLIKYLGLPLSLFGKGAFFQPYLPLQQIDMLIESESFLVGTTNSIFQQQRDCRIDVVVNIETATGNLNILDPRLVPLLALTPADRKWTEELVTLVDASWNANDPSRPLGLNFIGSDDFLRAKFEEYICSMLSCIKFTDYLHKSDRPEVLLSSRDGESNSIASFNESFIQAFRQTPAFELWNQSTDDVIFDLVEPRHPMEGKTNPLEDVGIRLAQGLHDLHIEENLAPTREAISGALESGWKTYASLKMDLGRRQRGFVEARERDRLASLSSRRDSSSPLVSPSGGGAERRESTTRSNEEGGLVNGLTPVIAVTATNVLATMDVAKTQASAFATGFGSFLSSKRRELFPATPPAVDPPSTPTPSTSTTTTTTTGTTAAAPSWSFPSFRRTPSSTTLPSSRSRTPEKVITANSLMGYNNNHDDDDEEDYGIEVRDLDAGEERGRDLDALHAAQAAAILRAEIKERTRQEDLQRKEAEEEVESPESSPQRSRVAQREREQEDEEEGEGEFVEAGEEVGELKEVDL